MIKIIIAIVAITVLGGAGVAVKNNMGKNSGPNATTTTYERASDKSILKRSMSTTTNMISLLNSKIPQECTFATSTKQGDASGALYVADGKMRADMVGFNPGAPRPYDTHFIYDGASFYMWSSLLTQGIRMNIPASELKNSAATKGSSINASQDFPFTCKDWNTDSLKFNLPSNVQFVDLQQQIQQQLQQQLQHQLQEKKAN